MEELAALGRMAVEVESQRAAADAAAQAYLDLEAENELLRYALVRSWAGWAELLEGLT